jgi:hypothetical protein
MKKQYRNILILLFCSQVLLGQGVLGAQTIIFVSVDGTGDGSSWENTANLETAVAGSLSGIETQIWVKEGIYFPLATIQVPAGVQLFGGFLGNETLLSQRNFTTNRTIIDGQKNFGVVHLGENAVLDGFAIINGHSHVEPDTVGGGVFMDVNARVENCYILDNTASGLGGGIYAVGDGLVYNTLFIGNAARIDGLSIYGYTLEVRNITVSENYLDGDAVTVDADYCNIATPAWVILGTQSFVSDSVWLTDTLLWSDVVTVNTCQKPTFDGGSLGPPPVFLVDCRSNPEFKGDLFSFCAVKRFGNFLCLTPWRVPSDEESVLFDFSIPTDKSVGFPLRCVRTCSKVTLDITAETTRHQTVCQFEPVDVVTHSWSGAIGNVTLSWDIVPNGISGTAESFFGTPTTPGVYTWTITAKHNEEICPPTISTGTITINTRPATVVVSGTTPACDSTILTASNGNSGTIFWQNTTPNGTCTDVECRVSASPQIKIYG